ncbi:MAG: hypothetical protein GX819_02240 [Clostridiaceae bacterium]|nr:hypothetical protein [Clostridiaceae bacterium]
MAKYERQLTGSFDALLDHLHQDITRGSVSASYEDGSDFVMGPIRVAVRVYERYSWFGGNRVSLNLTVVGEGSRLYVSAITSGGSQAVFFKINTLGEGAFLDRCIESVEDYMKQAGSY